MEQYDSTKKITDEKLQNIWQRAHQLSQRYSHLLDRQCKLTQQNDGSDDINNSEVIHLNVGGTKIYVLREALTKIKGSRLEALFSGRWDDELLRDEEGCAFLHLDANYFKMIIEHLHSIKVNGNDDSMNEEQQMLAWPKLQKATHQMIFDLYIDLFNLNKNDHESKNISNTDPHNFNSNNNINFYLIFESTCLVY